MPVRFQRLTQALLWLAVLAGCATPTPKSGTTVPNAPVAGKSPTAPITPPPVAVRPPPAPAASPLVSEQRWLDEWFRGTPVAIELADAHTLAVDVPLVHAFDAGTSGLKPALIAVLDRVVTSLRRQPAMRMSITAPADAAGAAALASARAQKVREHLVSRGIAATRLTGVGTARAGAPLQLRLLVVPQAIGRLDDATLPIPASGVRPAVTTAASGAKR